MNKKMIATQRKWIDIPNDAIKALKLKATLEGLPLKRFLEKIILEKATEEMSDEDLYQFLCDINPDAFEKASDEETELFEKSLGI